MRNGLEKLKRMEMKMSKKKEGLKCPFCGERTVVFNMQETVTYHSEVLEDYTKSRKRKVDSQGESEMYYCTSCEYEINYEYCEWGGNPMMKDFLSKDPDKRLDKNPNLRHGG